MNWQVSGASLLSETGAARSQLFIAECTDCRCRRSTVLCQQRERGFLGDAVILFHVAAVHRVDGVPSHAGDGLAGGERMRKLDLDWIHTGNVIDHHADLPSILREGASATRSRKVWPQIGRVLLRRPRDVRRGPQIDSSSLLPRSDHLGDTRKSAIYFIRPS